MYKRSFMTDYLKDSPSNVGKIAGLLKEKSALYKSVRYGLHNNRCYEDWIIGPEVKGHPRCRRRGKTVFVNVVIMNNERCRRSQVPWPLHSADHLAHRGATGGRRVPLWAPPTILAMLRPFFSFSVLLYVAHSYVDDQCC